MSISELINTIILKCKRMKDKKYLHKIKITKYEVILNEAMKEINNHLSGECPIILDKSIGYETDINKLFIYINDSLKELEVKE